MGYAETCSCGHDRATHFAILDRSGRRGACLAVFCDCPRYDGRGSKKEVAAASSEGEGGDK